VGADCPVLPAVDGLDPYTSSKNLHLIADVHV
jgi:hypothetical protein